MPAMLPFDRTYNRGSMTARNTEHVVDTFNNVTGEGMRTNKETGYTEAYIGTRNEPDYYDAYNDRGYVESTSSSCIIL